MTNQVRVMPGVLLFVGRALEAEEHAHVAAQVVWPCGDSELLVGNQRWRGPALVAGGVPHRLAMSEGLLLLIEPQSCWGEVLGRRLDGEDCVTLPLPELTPSAAGTALADGWLVPAMALLCSRLGLPLPGPAMTAVGDGRIRRLLQAMDECFEVDRCLKPQGWRAADAARSIALSESRFLHLFRDQMGMAWRPYLLWRRLLCAVTAMAEGQAATEAAHLAGFSDSAHLSRTFRRCFGLSIRQASRLLSRS